MRTRSGSIALGAFHGSRGGSHGSAARAVVPAFDMPAFDAPAFDARSANTMPGLVAIATTANNFVAFFFIGLAPSPTKTTEQREC
jgi:hypothetical protein